MLGQQIVAAIVLTLAIVGMAGTASADDLYDKCMAQSDGTNTAWSQCGGDWLKREDDRLNAVWKQAYGLTSGQTKDDLLAEQRLWIIYKESSCKFYANGDWGREGQAVHFATCRAGVIADRTEQLKIYGDFFAGN